MMAEMNNVLTIILGCAGLSLCLFLAFWINIVVTSLVQLIKERRGKLGKSEPWGIMLENNRPRPLSLREAKYWDLNALPRTWSILCDPRGADGRNSRTEASELVSKTASACGIREDELTALLSGLLNSFSKPLSPTPPIIVTSSSSKLKGPPGIRYLIADEVVDRQRPAFTGEDWRCPGCGATILEGAQIYVCERCGRQCCTSCSINAEFFDVICFNCTPSDLRVPLSPEPEVDDSLKCCPECDRTNQFGEICPDCLEALSERWEEDRLIVTGIK